MRRESINTSSLIPLQYIESTGTQWIDTGFKLNNNSRVVMDFMVTQYQSNFTHAACPFGARVAWDNQMFLLNIPANRYYSIYLGYGNSDRSFSNYNILNSTCNIDANKNSWKLKVGGSSHNNTFSSYTFQHTGNCHLFKCNYFGQAGLSIFDSDNHEIGEDSHIRIYSCDIYDNGTQVRKFRPYLNAGEAGMLDELNNVWYGNNGTGNFLYA